MNRMMRSLTGSILLMSMVGCGAMITFLDDMDRWNWAAPGAELSQSLVIFGVASDKDSGVALSILLGNNTSDEMMEIRIDGGKTYTATLSGGSSYGCAIVPLSEGNHKVAVNLVDYGLIFDKIIELDLDFKQGQIISVILERIEGYDLLKVFLSDTRDSQKLVEALYVNGSAVYGSETYLESVWPIIKAGLDITPEF